MVVTYYLFKNIFKGLKRNTSKLIRDHEWLWKKENSEILPPNRDLENGEHW